MQRTTQSLWWITTALIFTAQAVSAADMAVKAVPMPAPMLIETWAGFYIGVNVGYGAGRVRYATSTSNVFPGSAQFGTTDTTASERALTGVIGGGQIGYNWQMGPGWVLGVEA